MSTGSKQHYIPQHFQRAFAADKKKKQIWQFRRGLQKPIKTSISNTAVGRFFYTGPYDHGNIDLDAEITRYEQQLHREVDTLRHMIPGQRIDREIVISVATHLSVRANFIRGLGQIAIDQTADAVDNLTSSGFKLQSHRIPEAFMDDALNELSKIEYLDIGTIKPETFVRSTYTLAREQQHNLSFNFDEFKQNFTDQFRDSAERIMREAHNSALSEGLTPEAQLERLRSLTWSLVPGPPEGAALPDSVIIAFDGDQWNNLYMTRNLEIVVFPLTPNLLVQGIIDSTIGWNTSDFNKHAIEVAHEFILAADSLPILTAALPELGKPLISKIKDEIDSALTESKQASQKKWGTFFEPLNNDNNDHYFVDKNNIPENISYEVQFHNCANNETANAIAKTVNEIVIECKKFLYIHGISAFVFTNNYIIEKRKTLKSNLGEIPHTQPQDEYIGAAIPLRIEVDGKIKTKIVLQDFVATNLLSEDFLTIQQSLSVIVEMIADASFFEMIHEQFPSEMDFSNPQNYDRKIFQQIGDVFSSYFRSYFSSNFANNQKTYEDVALSTLDLVTSKSPEERRKYMTHRNCDTLLDYYIFCISDFLHGFARLAGSLVCSGKSIGDVPNIANSLKRHNLLDWFILFEQDLSEFRKNLNHWDDFEEIFFVVRHFERIAMQFGLFFEETDDGELYIHVPIGSDLDLLQKPHEKIEE